MTKDGRADPQRWREVRRRDNVRIYNERHTSSAKCPSTPQLLLLGTTEGKLEDVMYGAVATTNEAMKIQSACTKDNVLDSKVLYEIVRPSFEDPLRTVAVKWRLYEGHDFVTLDATGIADVGGPEQIGYSISHSVVLSEIPSFDEAYGIERENMSVCALYRQKTPTTVECYVRGFFDFESTKGGLQSTSLQIIATQWSAYARENTCALVKKLSWRVRKNCGWSSRSSRIYSFADDLNDFVSPTQRRQPPSSSAERAQCSVCKKAFGFLKSIRRTCTSCELPVCSKCEARKTVVALAPDQHTVLKRKRSFCLLCLNAVESCDVLSIAREELVGHQEKEETHNHENFWTQMSAMKSASDSCSRVVSRSTTLCSY
uniref:FYVE-type domain-containing protein n=1 Tax=Hyaloperonospora arabidopsidis (strain Emoy2) TaxID=559515 RepID=M4BFV9_HYAAE